MTSAAVSKHPDVIEAGRVLATLDDWRAITFVLIFLIVVMVIERGVAAFQMRRERRDMWDLAQQFGHNAEKIAEALSGVSKEIYALRAVSSRMESAAGGEK